MSMDARVETRTTSRSQTTSYYEFATWTAAGRYTAWASGAVLAFFLIAPLFLPAIAVDRLTTLWIYILLAVTWNLLAGFAGLVSVGQQAFFGASAYITLRLVETGMPPWPALVVGAICVAVIAIPLSFFILRLKDGEFAIATWVLAEVMLILVMFDPLIQGDTGNSLIALNSYAPELRRNLTYWLGLGSMAMFVLLAFRMLRSRIGSAAQAIRDDDEAAHSVGIDTMRIKQIIYVLAAFGAALAGVVWLASAITFLPRTNFGVQWTVFMLFMVLVGGLRSFEGPILGAVIFFLLQEFFDDLGVWYLAGLGGIAIVFALALPEGIWGMIRKRWGQELIPMGTTLVQPKTSLPPFAAHAQAYLYRKSGRYQMQIEVVDMVDQYVDVGGTKIRYRERPGTGTPLLFIHGIAESLEFWDRQLEVGIGQHRLLAFDLPGHGLSDLGDQPFDADKFASVSLSLADALGLDRFYVVGNSMGAATAVRMAAAAPERAAGIVLANAATLGREVFMPFRIMTLPLIGELMTKPGKAAVEQQLKSLFHDPAVVTDAIRETVSRNLAKPGGQQALLNSLRRMTSFGGQKTEVWERTRSLLKTLSLPVLFIHGKQDAVVPAQQSIDAEAITTGSKLMLFNDCGHTPQFEKPEIFNQALAEFVVD